MEKKEDDLGFIKWFSEIDKNSVSVVGGKGANLGEIYNLKISVPPGFAITAKAYDYFIEKNNLKEKISNLLKGIDYEDTKQLDESTKKIRELISSGEIPKEMEEEIIEAYEHLGSEPASRGEEVEDILERVRVRRGY